MHVPPHQIPHFHPYTWYTGRDTYPDIPVTHLCQFWLLSHLYHKRWWSIKRLTVSKSNTGIEHQVPIFPPTSPTNKFHAFLKDCIRKKIHNKIDWKDIIQPLLLSFRMFPGIHSKKSQFFLPGRIPLTTVCKLLSPRTRYLGDENVSTWKQSGRSFHWQGKISA